MRTLLVTAANEAYAPLLRGLVDSIEQRASRLFTDVACFDLGLAPDTREWIGRRAAHVVEPGWDLPVGEKRRAAKPDLRALTVRPFLPNYFPGYGVYVWIDANAWVQERYALDWYLEEAAKGALAAVPHVDRAYRHTSSLVGMRMNRMLAYFGKDAVAGVVWRNYFNAGVFALRSDAPHWTRWAKWFGAGLEKTKGELCCEETALNHALWTERLPVTPLPALCNWLCHLALPEFDAQRERFCEPFVPRNPIGILHLTGRTKRFEPAADGAAPSISLRYPGSQGPGSTD